MQPSYEAPTVALECQRAGVRPHGLARALTRAMGATLVVACALSLVISAFFPDGHPMPGWASAAMGALWICALASVPAALVAHALCWLTPMRRATLAVDHRGVHLVRGRGSRFVARDAIEAGWSFREGAAMRVELQPRNGDVVTADVPTPAAAAAVLDAAGVAPSRRALKMQLGGAASRAAIGFASMVPATCVAGVIAVSVERLLHLPSASAGFLIFTLVAVSVPAALRLLAPPKVTVGSDGVSVDAALRPWFVTFDQIYNVEVRGADLALMLRDGSTRVIPAIGTSRSRLEALYDRIAAGVADARAPRDLSARLAALDRNGRDLDAWREGLRAVIRERDDYRHAGLTRDEVAAALEDPHATPERRIGAALALGEADREQAAARVRVVLETVAHPPVRAALERAAGGELDEDVVNAATEEQAR